MVGDINRWHDVQIRDDSHPTQTESLEQGGAEVAPEELVRDLLKREWSATTMAPKPYISAMDDSMQAPMPQKTPSITVAVDDYRENPNGHRHEFVDIEVQISLNIKAFASRQQMYSMMAECRRIVYRWFLAVQPFHCLYWDGFRPDYAGPNNWSGTARLRLTADAIPAFKRRVAGEESPNTDPGEFPDGI